MPALPQITDSVSVADTIYYSSVYTSVLKNG
jgi:hypothetical protein